MQRLLITGATGLLGRKITELAKNDYKVIPLYNTRPLHPDSLKLDITNLYEISNLFKTVKPDIVVHTAAETNVDKCETQREHAWKINAEGTRNLALACSKTNTKIVYISTDYVFDGAKGNYNEQDRPNPANYYGVTKLEGENQVIQHCKNHAILRTSVLYGWHPWKKNFATWVISQLRQGNEVTVVEDHYNTPTLADNLAEIVVEVVQRNLQGLLHASGKERISRYEFAKKMAKIFNLNLDLIKPVKMSQLAAWTAQRPRDSSLDTGKIQKQLKTKPLNINEGLNKMKEEMKI
jgi:dTDP-4-dehydrorhamnose reductase